MSCSSFARAAAHLSHKCIHRAYGRGCRVPQARREHQRLQHRQLRHNTACVTSSLPPATWSRATTWCGGQDNFLL